MNQVDEIKNLAKALIRLMGFKMHGTLSNTTINEELTRHEGATPWMIDQAIKALTKADYIVVKNGIGVNHLESGQRLRPKGRRMAKFLRGEK